MIYEFHDCVLDTSTQELRRAQELVAVEPQVFAVLEHLLTNPDRVVTKIELLDEVWGDRFVSEAALTSRIKLARRACGDSGRTQQIIKTVHGRGYRMVAPVNERGGNPAVTAAAPVPVGPGAIGREHELAELNTALTAATNEGPVTAFVTGEPGAGKSTIVAEFVERSDDLDQWLVLIGRCHRHRTGPEPYFVLLEALGNLAVTEERLVHETLERVAPSWLLQLPALVDDDTAQRLERRLLGGARQRMLREGAEVFTALAQERPSLLVIEDLHLADDCTLDLVELVSSRRASSPLLVVATARPGSEGAESLISETVRDRSATLIEVGPLDRDAIGRLVADRYPGRSISAGLVDLVMDRSGGNPLFANEVVTTWEITGQVTIGDTAVTATADPTQMAATIPPGLIPLIEKSLESLDREESTVLEAAAAVGWSFDAAAAAAGLDRSIAETESVLTGMARCPDQISATGAATWPDGTVSTSYEFAHELYRDVIHERTPIGTSTQLHRRIGLALERGHGAAKGEIASQLADHFLAAGEAARAARYLRLAGARSLSRQAPERAGELLRRALDECNRLDPGPEHDTIEVGIRLTSAQAQIALTGWFDPDVSRHYERALELAAQLGAAEEEASARYGLATISEMHGNCERTEELLTPLLSTDDGDLGMEVHELVACSTFHQGAFARSGENSAAVLATWPEDTPSESMARVAEHPATSCNAWLALSNWFLGRSDESVQRADNAVRLGERHPYALATAIQQRAMLHQLRAEPDDCLKWARRTMALDRELVSRVRAIQADIYRGWALAAGATATGDDFGTDPITLLEEASTRLREAGVRLDAPYFAAIHADALLRENRPEESLAMLHEAEALIDETTRSYFHRSEIHRLRAVALLRLGGVDAVEQARAALDESLQLAWDMGSPAVALRTTCERFELEREAGGADHLREPLAQLLDRYDGQTPPPDVLRGRALLAD